MDDGAFRHLEADFAHGIPEGVTSLGLFDHRDIGPEQFHPVFVQHAQFGDLDGGVEGGLAAQGGQQRVRSFPLDDLGDHLRGDGLDVGPVSDLGIGHDGGGIGIDEDDFVAFLFQGLHRLGAGIVELAGLADDDGAGADNQNLFNVGSFRHRISYLLVFMSI